MSENNEYTVFVNANDELGRFLSLDYEKEITYKNKVFKNGRELYDYEMSLIAPKYDEIFTDKVFDSSKILNILRNVNVIKFFDIELRLQLQKMISDDVIIEEICYVDVDKTLGIGIDYDDLTDNVLDDIMYRNKIYPGDNILGKALFDVYKFYKNVYI